MAGGVGVGDEVGWGWVGYWVKIRSRVGKCGCGVGWKNDHSIRV